MPLLAGLRDKTDIKILICYMLAYIKKPLSLKDLCDVLIPEDIVNYFDLAEAWGELIASGHIVCDKADEKKCLITPLGSEAGESFERKLPLSIREKAIKSTLRMLAIAERDAETPCFIKPADCGGYDVTCTIKDGESTLLSTTLWVADTESANSVIEHFRSNPIISYSGIIAVMTGDINSVGSILSKNLDKTENCL